MLKSSELVANRERAFLMRCSVEADGKLVDERTVKKVDMKKFEELILADPTLKVSSSLYTCFHSLMITLNEHIKLL